MRLAYCIVMIILLCTYIAVEERETRIAKEEAYEKAIYEYIDKTTMEILRLRVKNKSLEQCLRERKEDESDECK